METRRKGGRKYRVRESFRTTLGIRSRCNKKATSEWLSKDGLEGNISYKFRCIQAKSLWWSKLACLSVGISRISILTWVRRCAILPRGSLLYSLVSVCKSVPTSISHIHQEISGPRANASSAALLPISIICAMTIGRNSKPPVGRFSFGRIKYNSSNFLPANGFGFSGS